MKKLLACLLPLIAALAPSSPLHAAPRTFESPPILMAKPEAFGSQAARATVAKPVASPLAAPSGDCTPDAGISRNGSIVTVALNFAKKKFSINNPALPDNGDDQVELRSYGGCKSGPAIFVQPGETLRVNLANDTDKYDPSCYSTPPTGLGLPPGVGCFNTTNLHTHGLHVSPAGNSDNVLLNIAPKTSFPYEINIPADHPAGTFWYHAHRHGSTAVQVASGASGALIIKGDREYVPPSQPGEAPQRPARKGDIDTILHDADGNPLKEQLFFLQQIAYACFEDSPNAKGGPWQKLWTTEGLLTAADFNKTPTPSITYAPWTCSPKNPVGKITLGVVENFGLQLDSPTVWDTNGRFTSINGVVQPTLTLPAGEIQRWRFVHAGIHDTVNLQIVRAAGNAANTPDGGKIIADSALSGNRLDQKDKLLAACKLTAGTLIPQFEIATDGLTRTKIRTIHTLGSGANRQLESNYLQPGYRSDILAVFPTEGDYCLIDQAAPPAERVTNGNGPGGQGPSTPQLLAYIHVQGGKAVTTDLRTYVETALYNANPQLPPDAREGLRSGDLQPWAPFDHLPAANSGSEQSANFTITGNPADPNNPLFQINGKSYDPNVTNITRQVNFIDNWLLTAQGEPHIFHIHVNPFEVLDVTTTQLNDQQISIFDEHGKCRPNLAPADPNGLASQYCGMFHVFRDTVVVQPGYQVHMRTKYDKYIGEYVIHCHILDHEDAGMMLNISIVPDLNAPGGGLGMPNMHHTATQTHQ